MRAYIAVGAGIDEQQWDAAHRAGARPDRRPYGLDRLAGCGITPLFRPAPRRPTPRPLAMAFRPCDPLVVRGARRPLREADVAFCWREDTGLPLALASPGTPVVTGVIWLTDEGRRRPSLLPVGAALRRARKVLVLSRAQVDPLVGEWGLDPEQVEYLTFGIATTPYLGFTADDAEPHRVVTAGNDRDRANGTLFDAVDQLRAEGLPVTLEVHAGANLGAAGPRDGVELHQRSTPVQVAEALGRAAVVVVSTRPNLHVSGMTVAIEAAMAGRPVIASRTPGFDDYVVDGVTGYLVEPGEPHELAARLRQLLDDPALRLRMGQAARERALREHSQERFLTSLASVLRSACA